MRHLDDVRTVGDLREALSGVDPSARIVWHYASADDGLWDTDCAATLDARFSAVFIDVIGSAEFEVDG